MGEGLRDYLPRKEAGPEVVLVQGDIPKKLRDLVRLQMKKDSNVTWGQLFTAACMKYLEESGIPADSVSQTAC
jgi:hypothetical protein